MPVCLNAVPPSGVLQRRSMPSHALGRNWDHIIYLPPGYENQNRKYPVLFLLHGNFGAPADFVDPGDIEGTANALIAAGKMAPAIIAMPDGGQSWYLDCGDLRMEDAILNEFIPFIEGSVRAIATRAARGIGGISMGGYGALRLAIRYPELFSALALMSPAVYADVPPANSSARSGAPFCKVDEHGKSNFSEAAWRAADWPSFIDNFDHNRWPMRVYLECGEQDEFGLANEARVLNEALTSRSLNTVFRLRPGGHDWATWKAALPDVLTFLSPPDNPMS